MKGNTFKKELQKFMTEEGLSRLKTAFDVVGDVAILEIDEEFEDKEKKIAETLLNFHKNIKTVLKKAGHHSGKFRRQRMQFLAGEDKRITLHKENNTLLYVDVEKSYFSPRLSTERKRIMQQVCQDENILVMFSGVGPYPCVIGKNKKPRRVVGVEMNPAAHKLALINKKKNKLQNAELFKGDVNKIVPEITQKPTIGLKSNWRKNHLKKKLPYKPEILEIYIAEGDLENYSNEFEEAIRELSQKNIKIVLHAPLMYKGTEVCAASNISEIAKNTKECFSYMEKLCIKYKLYGFVGHPYSFTKKEVKYKGRAYELKLNNIISFFKKNKYKHIFLENIMFGPFSNPKIIVRAAKKLSINLCLDIAHLYLACRTEDEFYESFKTFPKGTYFHLADAKYLNSRKKVAHYKHSFPVGSGYLNFDKILPHVREGVAEVINKDELNPFEMVNSWKKLNKIKEEITKFDRILMPLPKSAENFLPLALSAAKKNATIHFYDFLHLDEFHLAEEKAKKACKMAGFKYKKLDFVKCGQHSPRTFRVCLDFQVS
ncbi:MAG: TIM barrel protein [Candidatus Nanoarchaeia archaeon]